MNDEQKKRFYSKIDIPYDNMVFGCWEWTGRKSNGGRLFPYGQFDLFDKTYQAHRIAYLLWYGKESDNCVCHTCDNPSCVNPIHLFDATHTDNMKDKVNKKRSYKPNHVGSKNQSSKLTETQVLDIRSRQNQFHHDIAKEFDISRNAITSIINRKNWKHI